MGVMCLSVLVYPSTLGLLQNSYSLGAKPYHPIPSEIRYCSVLRLPYGHSYLSDYSAVTFTRDVFNIFYANVLLVQESLLRIQLLSQEVHPSHLCIAVELHSV